MTDVPALTVRQWLPLWSNSPFDPKAFARKPEPHFYLCSMPARQLASLCDVHRRGGDGPSPHRLNAMAVQRYLNDNRTDEIQAFVERGYPFSELSKTQQKADKNDHIVRPGWLPTALVLNILTADDERGGKKVHPDDLVTVSVGEGGHATLTIPEAATQDGWKPKGLAPMEVIDGQHRLYSLEDVATGDNYQLPVVVFNGLDITWQAYLFYLINIKPTRLNASLALDLFPLLRSQEWLEQGGDLQVYRQARAQEIVEVLWSHADSPWHERINMLGASAKGMVSQSAWVRAMTSTVVKSPKAMAGKVPGLFTGNVVRDQPLAWTRAQQAAYIMVAGQELRRAMKEQNAPWLESLKDEARSRGEDEPELGFFGRYSLLSTDQGIGGFLSTLNDLSIALAKDIELRDWQAVESADDRHVSQEAVADAAKSLRASKAHEFLKDLANELSRADWRSYSFEDLQDDEKSFKASLRGSGGYLQLRNFLLKHIARGKGPAGLGARRCLGLADDDGPKTE